MAGATATRGDAGRFSLKIWHIDSVTKGQVVDYNNQGAASGATGGPIVEGRIRYE